MGFAVAGDPEKLHPRVYNNLRNGKLCVGFGHQAKYHYDVLSSLAKRDIEVFKGALLPKGKGKDDRGG